MFKHNTAKKFWHSSNQYST